MKKGAKNKRCNDIVICFFLSINELDEFTVLIMMYLESYIF